ncbi:MAG: MptD family putative ECF transporter S component [Butyrivibrio sp.]|uniref:MptD family putative ECF transporter S component n=1 Tax=Butyrivibrio sp. TaxID=28121 RepID=UPI0025D2EC5A|nr:MptD family putative ECF transporter S component [Butyrivibrio sp.]MCR5770949.1 MptD family putative ECF transporter S component [Butyrivibrio sp.]
MNTAVKEVRINTTENEESGKMTVKDLITVGIFTVIYFVIFFISAMTGMVPVMAIFYPVLIALLAGIPCILFYTKVKKFGMVTIMATLSAVLLALMGYGYMGIITGLVFGLIADLILKSGKYKSAAKMVLGYAVFSEWVIGTQLPMFIGGNAYAEAFRQTQGDEFVDELEKLISWGMCGIVVVTTFVAAIIGAYIGKAVLKKHFERAGII